MKKVKWVDLIFFIIGLSVIAAVTFFLFYHQVMTADETYPSDMLAYIKEMQGIDSGYSFPYPVLFKLGAFINLFTKPETAMALATCILNSLGIVLLKLELNKRYYTCCEKRFTKAPYIAGVLLSLVAFSLFFISMLWIPGEHFLSGIRFKYLGVFTANPYHNATFLAARPFTILAFFLFADLLDSYESKNAKWKDYLLFSLALLAATMTKPSFTIVFVGAVGLIMLYRLIKSGFKNFKSTILLGLCFIPTFIDLLYQFKGVFVSSGNTESGIGFGFGEVWGLYITNFPGAILLALLFPIVVLILNWKTVKSNTVYRLSWQTYIMSFLMAFFLYEKGFRKPDFNFSWGYMYGIFFVFLGSVIVLIQSTAESKSKDIWKIILEWILFLTHVLFGLYFFYGLLKGQTYY